MNVPVNIIDISLSNGELFLLDNTQNCYYFDNYLNGIIRNITISGVTNLQKIFFVSQRGPFTDWTKLSTRSINNVAYSNGKIFFTYTDFKQIIPITNKHLYISSIGWCDSNSLFINDLLGPSDTILLKKLTFDGVNNVITAIDDNNAIWYADAHIYTQPKWKRVEKLSQPQSITYSNRQLFCTSGPGEIFYNKNYEDGSWVKTNFVMNNSKFYASKIVFSGNTTTIPAKISFNLNIPILPMVVTTDKIGNLYYCNTNIISNMDLMLLDNKNKESKLPSDFKVNSFDYSNGILCVISKGILYYSSNYTSNVFKSTYNALVPVVQGSAKTSHPTTTTTPSSSSTTPPPTVTKYYGPNTNLLEVQFDGFQNFVICLDNKGQLFYSFVDTFQAPIWEQISTPNNVQFIHIYYSNYILFALDSNGNMWNSSDYYINIKNTTWSYIRSPSNSKISQISFDGFGDIIFVLDINGNVSYSNINIYTNPIWIPITGITNITYISLSNNQMMYLDNKGNLYYTDNYKNNYDKFVHVTNSKNILLTKIMLNASPNPILNTNISQPIPVLVGVDSNGIVYSADSNTPFKQISSIASKNISYSIGKIFAVQKDGTLSYNSNYLKNSWISLPIPASGLQQIYFDGINNVLVCLDSTGTDIYYSDTNNYTNPAWTKIGSGSSSSNIFGLVINYVCCSNNKLLLLANSQIYYNSNYKLNTWVKIYGPNSSILTQLNIDGFENILVVLDKNNKIWYSNEITQNPKWAAITQSLPNGHVPINISYSYGKIFVVDEVGNIYSTTIFSAVIWDLVHSTSSSNNIVLKQIIYSGIMNNNILTAMQNGPIKYIPNSTPAPIPITTPIPTLNPSILSNITKFIPILWKKVSKYSFKIARNTTIDPLNLNLSITKQNGPCSKCINNIQQCDSVIKVTLGTLKGLSNIKFNSNNIIGSIDNNIINFVVKNCVFNVTHIGGSISVTSPFKLNTCDTNWIKNFLDNNKHILDNATGTITSDIKCQLNIKTFKNTTISFSNTKVNIFSNISTNVQLKDNISTQINAYFGVLCNKYLHFTV